MEHEWNTNSLRAFVFPRRVIETATGPIAQQYVPDESGQRSWEDLEAPASVCGEILRLAQKVAELEAFIAVQAASKDLLRAEAAREERAFVRRELLAAIENQDFDDWRDAVAMRDALDRICPENQAVLQEAHGPSSNPPDSEASADSCERKGGRASPDTSG